jgi:hydroxymethylpyrimidine pyrophosphatase-like HAD family hydrolase
MVPRLVATDLDGTLVRSDGTISRRTREVLAAVEAAGAEVVFVTGRPLRWAEEVFDHVGRHGLAIISNGALVWDVAKDGAHLVRPIDPVLGLDVCRRIRAAVPGTAFAVETLEGIALEHAFLERHPLPVGSRRGDLADIFGAPAVKLLARHEVLEPQEFWDRALLAVGEDVVITWSSTSSLLEISAAGVTKASTLALLCEGLGIGPGEVVAFGDMPNDLPLLAWAGTSYAMANAHASVREAAGQVAPSNDDDGVALVLADLFGLG